jgi:hypothetical protein
MLKKIYLLLLPLYISLGLHAQTTIDTFSTRYKSSDTLAEKKLAALNEKIKKVNKVLAEKTKKQQASKQRGRLIAAVCLFLMTMTVLLFRYVNRNELSKEKE